MNRDLLLATILSLIAGSADVISFLALDGLFISHITGNLVILAVHIVNVGQAPLSLILSVPVFIIMLALSRVLVYWLKIINQKTLAPLLTLQFLFLLGFLLLGTSLPVFAGMLGVSAMAVQNALVQLSLKGVSATAVMTTNVTRFVLDIMTVMLGNPQEATTAHKQAMGIWPTIIGFILGCTFGAILEDKLGLLALILPTSLAFIALFVSFL